MAGIPGWTIEHADTAITNVRIHLESATGEAQLNIITHRVDVRVADDDLGRR